MVAMLIHSAKLVPIETAHTNKQRGDTMTNSAKAMKIAHKMFKAHKAAGKNVLNSTFGKLLKAAWSVVKSNRNKGYYGDVVNFILDGKLVIKCGLAIRNNRDLFLVDGFKVNLAWYHAEQASKQAQPIAKTGFFNKLKNLFK